MKLVFTFFFFLYIVIFIDFTLIDGTFGRNISNVFSLNSAEIKEYIKENTNYLETDLEKNILEHLKEFLLELGKGFTFIENEYKIK